MMWLHSEWNNNRNKNLEQSTKWWWWGCWWRGRRRLTMCVGSWMRMRSSTKQTTNNNNTNNRTIDDRIDMVKQNRNEMRMPTVAQRMIFHIFIIVFCIWSTRSFASNGLRVCVCCKVHWIACFRLFVRSIRTIDYRIVRCRGWCWCNKTIKQWWKIVNR